MLQDGSDFLSCVMRRRLAKPGKTTGSRVGNAHQHSQRGCFAAAIRPQHAKHLTAVYFQTQIMYRGKFPEPFGEVADLKNVFHTNQFYSLSFLLLYRNLR
jgi:hypothetical protein